MSESAGVASVDAIRDFRGVLCSFSVDVSAALTAVELEVLRFKDWLEVDRYKYWQREVLRRQELVANAKSDLARKRMMASKGEPPQISEEQKQLKKAQIRLEEAEDKVKRVVKWRGALEHAFTEYRGQAQHLQTVIDADMPAAVALLDRITARLESYLSLSAAGLSDSPSFSRSTDSEPAPRVADAASVGSDAGSIPHGTASGRADAGSIPHEETPPLSNPGPTP